MTRDGASMRERWAWYLYDAGNSAYAAVVLLAVYATYFKDAVVGGALGSFYWGISVTTATAVVAVIAPILGGVADASGGKRRFLLLFTTMACAFTASLFFVTEGAIALGMALFILAEVGYRSGQVFYNAFLPEIATEREMGRVSGNGWAIGSAGGVLCLLIVLAAVKGIGGTLVVRGALIFTALYFAAFAIPMFRWVRERAEKRALPRGRDLVILPFRRLWQTVLAARKHREFGKFLLAFLLYNEGILITLSFGAILGATLFGLEQEQLIVFMILVQVASVPGAFLPGLMVGRVGVRATLLLSLVGLVGAVLWLFFAQTTIAFYVIGAIAGFSLTAAQSVSRATVGLLAPKGQSAEFYGFFAIAGRTSSAVGPAVFGAIVFHVANALERSGQTKLLAEQAAHRYALFAIIGFLIVGGLMLLTVSERAGRASEEEPV
jgi:UMF1 family MFS transporter